MNKSSRILLLLFLILPIISSDAFSDEILKHFLLLNDDKIISGELITFHDGFLFLKQEDRILKISPAHFKGIFCSQPDAEKTVALLNQALKVNANNDNIQQPKTPFDHLTSIYSEARAMTKRPNAVEEINALLNEVTTILVTPEDLLDNEIFNKVALLAAVSDLQNLDENLLKLFKEHFNSEALSRLPIKDRGIIKSRLHTLEFLITHTVSEKE